METMTTNSGNDMINEEHSPMLTSSSNSHFDRLSNSDYEQMNTEILTAFSAWDDREQLLFVENLLKRMHSHQHGQINTFLLPMLQRDFIGQLAARGLEHIAEKILGYLDDRTLVSTELVCRDWYHVISAGMVFRSRRKKNSY